VDRKNDACDRVEKESDWIFWVWKNAIVISQIRKYIITMATERIGTILNRATKPILKDNYRQSIKVLRLRFYCEFSFISVAQCFDV